MKTLKVTTLMIVMSFGLHCFGATTNAAPKAMDAASVATEENRNISAAEINALQQRAEFDTQSAINLRPGDEMPRYEARQMDTQNAVKTQ